jgi:hypothetical protein
MEDFITQIKLTEIGDVTVSTIYMENLHDYMQTLLEAVGKDDSHEAQRLLELREQGRGKEEMLSRVFNTPLFGPYYETIVTGGENYNGFMKRCISVSEAISQHEEIVGMVREGLGGNVPGETA